MSTCGNIFSGSFSLCWPNEDALVWLTPWCWFVREGTDDANKRCWVKDWSQHKQKACKRKGKIWKQLNSEISFSQSSPSRVITSLVHTAKVQELRHHASQLCLQCSPGYQSEQDWRHGMGEVLRLAIRTTNKSSRHAWSFKCLQSTRLVLGDKRWLFPTQPDGYCCTWPCQDFENFQYIFARERNINHLAVLEVIFITTYQPVLWSQKDHVRR